MCLFGYARHVMEYLELVFIYKCRFSVKRMIWNWVTSQTKKIPQTGLQIQVISVPTTTLPFSIEWPYLLHSRYVACGMSFYAILCMCPKTYDPLCSTEEMCIGLQPSSEHGCLAISPMSPMFLREFFSVIKCSCSTSLTKHCEGFSELLHATYSLFRFFLFYCFTLNLSL